MRGPPAVMNEPPKMSFMRGAAATYLGLSIPDLRLVSQLPCPGIHTGLTKKGPSKERGAWKRKSTLVINYFLATENSDA